MQYRKIVDPAQLIGPGTVMRDGFARIGGTSTKPKTRIVTAPRLPPSCGICRSHLLGPSIRNTVSQSTFSSRNPVKLGKFRSIDRSGH
jgi:hypothetical protein